MKLYTPSHLSGRSTMSKVGVRGLKMPSSHYSMRSSISIKTPKISSKKIKI